MTNSTDYRQYLEEKFHGLTTTMNAQFVEIHERLDKIEIQTTKTNGNVSKLEKDLITQEKELLQHALSCPKGEVIEQIRVDLEDYRFFKRYPKLSFFIIACFVVALLYTVYNGYQNVAETNTRHELLDEIKMLKQEVNTINESIIPSTRGQHYDPFAKDTVKNKIIK